MKAVTSGFIWSQSDLSGLYIMNCGANHSLLSVLVAVTATIPALVELRPHIRGPQLAQNARVYSYLYYTMSWCTRVFAVDLYLLLLEKRQRHMPGARGFLASFAMTLTHSQRVTSDGVRNIAT